MKSQNNLKQIGLALHNYHDTYGHFPAPAIYSKAGKPLLSWRVAILPWVEQDALYKQFHLDEPWDSEHNKALLKQMPPVYAPVGARPKKPGLTYYQAIVGKGAAFEPRRGLKVTDFTDGLSNTILVAEAATPVPWTKPEDLPYAPDKALPKFGGLFGGNFNAVFGDGSVHFLSKKADPDQLRAAITRAGGETPDLSKIEARGTDLFKGRKLDAKALSRANDRLKRMLENTVAEVKEARKDIEVLKLKARGLPNVDPATLKLMQENARLQENLEKALAELENLKQEKARLQGELGRKKK